MAHKDSRGLEVSSTNNVSVDRLESATELLNGYFGDPLAAIDRALADDPDFIMGHCFRAGPGGDQFGKSRRADAA
jgi:hypothetical protein